MIRFQFSSRSDPNQRYWRYCAEHALEFRNELRNEAMRAITSWPGRTAAALLIISSLMTYLEAVSDGNRMATYTLFSYAFPVSLILVFPLITLLSTAFEKYSQITLDIICLFGLLGFLFTVHTLFQGTDAEHDLQTLYRPLQGQIAFVLALATAFAYHLRFWVTLLRNIGFTLLSGTIIFLIDATFFYDNRLPLVEGLFLGSIISWVFNDSVRARFYLKSTDADTRQHLYKQLSKLVYPHQLEQIKLGDELEHTMPLGEGRAIVNVFDVQRSSSIRHPKAQSFFEAVFRAFLDICMEGYEHNPLRSRAFRLKETGDGFISAMGYPFLSSEARSLADSALATALEMFAAFNREVRKFNYHQPIKGAMGLAYNRVQGTFQSGGIRSYDLFGEALIQAAKYEELRKQPLI